MDKGPKDTGTGLTRTSRIEAVPISRSDSEDGEPDNDDDFPVLEFLHESDSRILTLFSNRHRGLAAPLREEVTMEELRVPDLSSTIGASVTLSVQMLDIQNVLRSIGHQDHFVHSWCDLRSVASVEAKRVISSFFIKSYSKLDKSVRPLKSDIHWSDAPNSAKRRVFQNSQATDVRIYHYVGIGYPPPDENGIWISGHCTVKELCTKFQAPCFLVFDCDRAGILQKPLMMLQDQGPLVTCKSRLFFAVFACGPNQVLEIPNYLPQNFFSCVLLSPELCFEKVTGIEVTNVETFLELLNIITESIALDVLPTDVFYQLFRGHSSIAALWRRFLLAQRLMTRFGISVRSLPDIAYMGNHRLWTQFEYGVMMIGKTDFIKDISQMYLRQFDKVKLPEKYVCSVAATMLQFTSDKGAILSKIYEFMMQSPANCTIMAGVLSPTYLGDYASASGSSYFRSWCGVVSGLTLAVPSMAKIIMNKFATESMNYITAQPKDEQICVLLSSILVSLRDSHRVVSYTVDSHTSNLLIPLLFTTPPLVREWVSILLHASFARFSLDPNILGPTGLHVYAMLLLYDNRKYTRAAGIAILTSIMAPKFPYFNATVMNCAMKAAIDGHKIVRHAYALCVARYANLNKDDCAEQRDYTLDFYIRKDIARSYEEDIFDKPSLRQSLQFLLRDPDKDIRQIAEAILQCPHQSQYLCGFQENNTLIHRSAHMSLFSKSGQNTPIIPRYDEHLFHVDDLQLLEVRALHDSRVTFLCFDSQHSNLICGYDDGTIRWGGNVWHITSSVVEIVHLPKSAFAAASATGEIYVFTSGCRSRIEVFNPSISKCNGTTIMQVVPGTGKTFIAQGNNEIVIWDLEALLAIDYIVTSSPPVHFVLLGSKLLCALTLGSVIQVDINTHQIEREYTAHGGHRIVKMGQWAEKLYTVIDNGELYVWESLDHPQLKGREEGLIDFCVHRTYPCAVRVTPKSAFLTNMTDSAPTPLSVEGKLPVRCCFDDMRPMCAIGYSDGSYSVWRIPKPIASKPVFC